MALQQTTLTAAITPSQLVLPVASLAAFPPIGTKFVNQCVLIDGEYMWCVGVQTGAIVVRCRGSEGTAAAAHDALAQVITSAVPGDFPMNGPQQVTPIAVDADAVVTVGADGAIPVPLIDTVVNINKGSAAALTLAAPSLASNGVRLTLTSQTAFAHVVTATALLADAVSGSPHTTATFAAFKGASINLIAENGLWHVAGSTGVTVT